MTAPTIKELVGALQSLEEYERDANLPGSSAYVRELSRRLQQHGVAPQEMNRNDVACMAMQGLLAAPYPSDPYGNLEHMLDHVSDGISFSGGMRGRIAACSFAMADAMIQASKQENKNES